VQFISVQTWNIIVCVSHVEKLVFDHVTAVCYIIDTLRDANSQNRHGNQEYKEKVVANNLNVEKHGEYKRPNAWLSCRAKVNKDFSF